MQYINVIIMMISSGVALRPESARRVPHLPQAVRIPRDKSAFACYLSASLLMIREKFYLFVTFYRFLLRVISFFLSFFLVGSIKFENFLY